MDIVSIALALVLIGTVVHDAVTSWRLKAARAELLERRNSQEWLATGWEQTEVRAGNMEFERNQARAEVAILTEQLERVAALAEANRDAWLATDACLHEERTADSALFQFDGSDEEYVN